MSAVLPDTNVLIVANRPSDRPVTWAEVCVNALAEAQQGIVVLDDGFHIIREYRQNVSESGQPGAGDAFLLWILRNRWNTEVIVQVPITPDDERGIAEFPDDPELAKFDRSDRKFVAIAIVSEHKPEILNAVDTNWWHFREPLAKHGVTIQFLCPEAMPNEDKQT